MKYNRSKKVKKSLKFFINNYKFHKPYQILIDGTFTMAALQAKFNIREQLMNYLQSEVKLLTTQCLILESEKLASKLQASLLILKQFGFHKCGHEKNPVGGEKCILSMVGLDNSTRYFVATQDKDLQNKLRSVPGVPLIYLHGRAPVLEPPNNKSRESVAKLVEKTMVTESQEKTLNTMKEKFGLVPEKEVKPKKKHKKGGPNPLSCKKKKKKNPEQEKDGSTKKVDKSGKIRKRKRIKIAPHIKEALFNQQSD